MGRLINGASVALALASLICGGAPLLAQTAQATSSAAPGDLARMALAREIIDLGVPSATREDMFFKVMDQMMVQMREAALRNVKSNDPEVIAILDTWLKDWVAAGKVQLRGHIPALMDGWAAAYADIYTEQELRDIRTFVATPSGASFFRKMQDVLASPKFAAANQAYMNDIMGRLPEAQAALMTKLKAHFEKTGTD